MRKAIIILAGLGIVALGYWGYLRLSGDTALDLPDIQRTHRTDMPRPADRDESESTRQTVIHGAEQSYYVTRDPETRQIRRVFGFSRLMNPGSPSARWHVEAPYIVVYEPSYSYRMDAENGVFQIDRTGSTIVPRDGRLDGNVVIRIHPEPENDFDEITIKLDDLMFSSERTEFSTDGPVDVASDRLDLSGRGLVLMVNAKTGQIEYLNILDLNTLRLKDFLQEEGSPPSFVSVSNDTDTPDANAEPAADQQHVQRTAIETPDSDLPVAEAKRSYQCVIENNVLIRYGDQIVLSGAEQISIQNILFSSQQAPSVPSSAEPHTETTDAPPRATASEAMSAEPSERERSRRRPRR